MLGALFKSYITNLIDTIPYTVYVWLFVLFCACSVNVICRKGIKRGKNDIAWLLVVVYVILIYCSTIFFRRVRGASHFEFHPFWSYRSIMNGNLYYLAENIMNVLVFIPLGIFLAVASRRMTFRQLFMISLSVSTSIELLQYFSKRGFCEIDDVIHNVFGCMLGYGFVKAIMALIKKNEYRGVKA